MRTTNLISSFLLMSAIVSPAFAAADGMHKHDAPIATYSYNIAIDTPASMGSGGSLRDDLDNGTAREGVVRSSAPVQTLPATSPAAGNAQALQAPAMPAPVNTPPQAAIAAPMAAALQVGSAAPNFQLARADGQVVGLNDVVKTGPVLVLFANTSSPYGLQQMQLLQKNSAQLKQLGINTVAVSSEPMDSLQRATQKFGITYPILSDASGYVGQQYGVQSTAALYTIDQTGKIAAVQTQSNGQATFNLSEATATLRSQQATAAPAPAPAAASPAAASTSAAPAAMATTPPAQRAPIASMSSQDEMMAPSAPTPVPPGQQQLAPQQQMPEAGKVNFQLPPSHPDFSKVKSVGIAI